jgi:hypothetical protein
MLGYRMAPLRVKMDRVRNDPEKIVEAVTDVETNRSRLVRRLSYVATFSINGSSSSVLAVVEPSQCALRSNRACG